jgi:hypothetical protein
LPKGSGVKAADGVVVVANTDVAGRA